jgi:hypothetical protein
MSTEPVNADITDVEQWLPLDGLEPGFDHNRLPLTDELNGRQFVIDLDGPDQQGRSATLSVTSASQAHWQADWMPAQAGGAQDCDIVAAAEGLFFVDMVPVDRAAPYSVTVALDLTGGRATVVLSTLGEHHQLGKPSVGQDFLTGTVRGVPVTGQRPHPTTELVGKRVLYVYSDQHAYEHVYLNEHFYSWQCLAGPERGQADTDPATAYWLREQVYLFAWREKVIPCASVIVIDLGERRSTGKLVGRGSDGRSRVNFSFGAFAHPLNETAYPDGLKPATTG